MTTANFTFNSLDLGLTNLADYTKRTILSGVTILGKVHELVRVVIDNNFTHYFDYAAFVSDEVKKAVALYLVRNPLIVELVINKKTLKVLYEIEVENGKRFYRIYHEGTIEIKKASLAKLITLRDEEVRLIGAYEGYYGYFFFHDFDTAMGGYLYLEDYLTGDFNVNNRLTSIALSLVDGISDAQLGIAKEPSYTNSYIHGAKLLGGVSVPTISATMKKLRIETLQRLSDLDLKDVKEKATASEKEDEEVEEVKDLKDYTVIDMLTLNTKRKEELIGKFVYYPKINDIFTMNGEDVSFEIDKIVITDGRSTLYTKMNRDRGDFLCDNLYNLYGIDIDFVISAEEENEGNPKTQ